MKLVNSHYLRYLSAPFDIILRQSESYATCSKFLKRAGLAVLHAARTRVFVVPHQRPTGLNLSGFIGDTCKSFLKEEQLERLRINWLIFSEGSFYCYSTCTAQGSYSLSEKKIFFQDLPWPSDFRGEKYSSLLEYSSFQDFQ